jgi:hypothetical protein
MGSATIILTRINIEKTTDSFLKGNDDELQCEVYSWAPPVSQGPSKLKRGGPLHTEYLGTWGYTQHPKEINRDCFLIK